MYQDDRTTENESYDRYRERLTNFSQEFELGLFIHLARKSFWWVVLFFFLAFAASFVYLRYTQPIYESASTLQLKESNQANMVLDLKEMGEKKDIAGDIEIIKSKEFLKTIFDKLPLDISYYSEGEVLRFELYKTAPYQIDYEIKSPDAYNYKYYVFFPSKNEVKLNAVSPTESYEKVIPVGELVDLGMVEIRFTILDFETIHEQQSAINNGDSYFEF